MEGLGVVYVGDSKSSSGGIVLSSMVLSVIVWFDVATVLFMGLPSVITRDAMPCIIFRDLGIRAAR